MRKATALLFLALVSCTGGGTPRPTASPSGPPTIQPDVIARHAEQFDEDLPERRAGSQQEFAAATYITAHLQQAGYVVEFDSVPVADTVRSTNVVALPPSTEDPDVLVVTAYDDGSDAGSIGAFLEVARALRVAIPDHSIEFAALGAEGIDLLGSRRMIKLLQDRDLSPSVIAFDLSSAAGDLYEGAGFDYSVVEGRPEDLLDVLAEEAG